MGGEGAARAGTAVSGRIMVRNASSPTAPLGRNGVSLRGRLASPAGIVFSASRPRAVKASAMVSPGVAAGHGVVMTMGKGGVGKTAIAASIAVSLARRGHRVTLCTTDPAAHVSSAVDGEVAGLTVTRIDPEKEVAIYRDEVLAKAGAGLDAAGRTLLEEDLRSPCTEEIAVFRAFARTVDQGEDRVVVLDTAPTGHTILLLDGRIRRGWVLLFYYVMQYSHRR